jgi:hypothetical protein
MADKRKDNGGNSTKSTKENDLRRKDKQIELIEKLTPLEPLALEKLEKGVKDGDFRFVKLYFEYRWGKAKETKDITLAVENNLPEWLDE